MACVCSGRGAQEALGSVMLARSSASLVTGAQRRRRGCPRCPRRRPKAHKRSTRLSRRRRGAVRRRPTRWPKSHCDWRCLEFVAVRARACYLSLANAHMSYGVGDFYYPWSRNFISHSLSSVDPRGDYREPTSEATWTSSFETFLQVGEDAMSLVSIASSGRRRHRFAAISGSYSL